jgi:membrane protease YdiL (CAAX protease family)
VLVASIAGYHVVDHRRIPERWHAAAHAAVAAAVLAAGRGLGLSWEELGLHHRHAAAGTRLATAHAVGPVVGLLAASTLPWVEDALADPRVADLPAREVGRRALIDIPIGTAVYEEVVFRGVLLGLLRRHGSDAVAVAGSSALFGLWHVLPALADRQHNPTVAGRPAPVTVGATVASTALAGAWFAAIRLRSGSLLAPILLHAGVNVAGLLAATVVDRRRTRRRDVPPSRSPEPRD